MSLIRKTSAGVLLAGLFLANVALACGPDYRYWYHINYPAPFDPLAPRSSDSTYVFRQIFPQKSARRDVYERRQLAIDNAYTELDALFSKHRPDILFLPPGRVDEFRDKHCFAHKYRTLRKESDSILYSMATRIERFDIENNMPEGVSRPDYRPAYDQIPDPSSLGDLGQPLPLRAKDRYSSYLASLRNNLTPCYADNSTPGHWQATRQLLLQMQSVPEYESWSTLALIVGYANSGAKKEARKLLQKLAAGPEEPALEQLREEVIYLVTHYEDVLQDDAIMQPPRLFQLDLSAPRYLWGSCGSNSLDNARRFSTAAITDKNLADAEVEELLAYRTQLLFSCLDQNALPAFIETLKAKQETPYHAYLLAAGQFYHRDYSAARQGFARLAEQGVPWISETSLYLTGRSLLLASQSRWNGYYRDDTIDKSLAIESADVFSRYLSEYPDGRYVDSATGLIRRAHWLSGDESTYRSMLSAAKDLFLREKAAAPTWTETEIEDLQALFLEFKLRAGLGNPDNTLAVMEGFVSDYPSARSGAESAVARAQDFVAAYSAFAGDDPAAVVARYGGKNDLNGAELLLLARAYEKLDQIDAALAVWQSELADAGLAQAEIDYETSKILFRSRGVEGVVRDENIANINVKRVYLGSLCDSSLQKRLIDEALPEETQHAVFVDLALRYLFAGDFEELDQLLEAQPADVIGEYAAITTAVSDIANGRSLGRAYMNIAYFLQTIIQTPLFGLEDYLAQETAPQCRQNTVAAGVNGPYYYFNKSLSYFAADDRSVDEQKSLYYLTMCFKQGTASRTCLWGDRPADALSSKEAFTRLHTKYKDGEWAEKAKYYYE